MQRNSVSLEAHGLWKTADRAVTEEGTPGPLSAVRVVPLVTQRRGEPVFWLNKSPVKAFNFTLFNFKLKHICVYYTTAAYG